ncbi:MAG: hypothetical protein BGN83_19725 [Rhizobium sp. 63-7]|nr:MAG: hypothetical protein BGN83_19725 [Rhizobium sp. 63-7]
MSDRIAVATEGRAQAHVPIRIFKATLLSLCPLRSRPGTMCGRIEMLVPHAGKQKYLRLYWLFLSAGRLA